MFYILTFFWQPFFALALFMKHRRQAREFILLVYIVFMKQCVNELNYNFQIFFLVQWVKLFILYCFLFQIVCYQNWVLAAWKRTVQCFVLFLRWPMFLCIIHTLLLPYFQWLGPCLETACNIGLLRGREVLCQQGAGLRRLQKGFAQREAVFAQRIWPLTTPRALLRSGLVSVRNKTLRCSLRPNLDVSIKALRALNLF